MNAQEVIKTLRDALSYYAAGNHIQHDTLGVASQPYVEPGHRAADALADTLVDSIDAKDTGGLIYPPVITTELSDVLGLLNFKTGPIAHVYRAAGHEIAHKCEVEQSFVLNRLIRIVLEHRTEWREVASKDLSAARDAAIAVNKPANT